jgi:hypothetical protein
MGLQFRHLRKETRISKCWRHVLRSTVNPVEDL